MALGTKRRVARVAVEWDLVVEPNGSDVTYASSCLDISTLGSQLMTPGDYRANDWITVFFAGAGGRTVSAVGSVVHARTAMALSIVGVQWIYVSPAMLRLIRGVARISERCRCTA